MTNPWIDISVPVYHGMVHWPGDPEVEVRKVADLASGDSCNLTSISTCVHVGTHMDAPLHFLAGGRSMDELPFDAVMGPARVIAIEDPIAIRPAELERWNIQAGERILFKTLNSGRCWQSERFVEDFVYIHSEAAEILARAGVRTVGIDYLSVGEPGADGGVTHRRLLEAGIWIVEGLNLSAVDPGNYEFVCLPLRLMGAEGAPARAVLRRTG